MANDAAGTKAKVKELLPEVTKAFKNFKLPVVERQCNLATKGKKLEALEHNMERFIHYAKALMKP